MSTQKLATPLHVFAIALATASVSAMARTVEIPLGEATFSTPTTIDNPYWPLPMGSTFSYRAETDDGCEYNKITVTTDDEMVDGYTTLVVRDQAWVSEECAPASAILEEDTLDFYAQDDDGNIWYFGEDTWSLPEEDSELCSDDGAWRAGEEGAEAGIVMLAEPGRGDRYRQEYWEDEAEDWGAVLRDNASVSIDYGDFEECLVTREWTPLEPGEIEQKFYCPEPGNPGPGLVYIRELKGKTVNVEFIGVDMVLGVPGEFDEFPALDCMLPGEE